MTRHLCKAAIPAAFIFEWLLVSLILLGLAAEATAGSDREDQPWIVHHRFEDFASGTLRDGGVNTFISAEGTVQMIHRMDLNNDGYPDLMIGQDHNHFENEDVLIYRGSREGPQSILPPLPQLQLFFYSSGRFSGVVGA